MMDLGQLCDESTVVDPFDDIELPQRTISVEGSGHDSAHHFAELLGCARRRYGMVTYMEVEVEVRVFDPVRQVEAERDLDQSAPKGCQLVDALEQQLFGGLEAAAAWSPTGVEQIE